jgi:hypothetical protein
MPTFARALEQGRGFVEGGLEALHDAIGKSDFTTLGRIEPPVLAADLQARLPASLQGKTVSTAEGSRTMSGFLEKPTGYSGVSPADVLSYTREIGAPVRRAGAFDRGTPGQYFASHAERQAAMLEPGKPIDVSSPMCDDCIVWMQKHAARIQRPQPVTDPNVTRVFNSDGTIEIHHPDGTIEVRQSWRPTRKVN